MCDKTREEKFDLMTIAGMLSDCQELIGPDLNDEDGWVSPDNAQMVTRIMNNAKELMFKEMRDDRDNFERPAHPASASA